MRENNLVRWDAAEVAFVYYAYYMRPKRIKLPVLANILGRSKAAVNTELWNYRQYMKRPELASVSQLKRYPHVDALISAVKLGNNPDQVKNWEARLFERAPSDPVVEKVAVQTPEKLTIDTIEGRSGQEVYHRIIEWLYNHQDGYESAKEWRKQFGLFLKTLLGIDNQS